MLPETSVTNNHSTVRKIPEEYRISFLSVSFFFYYLLASIFSRVHKIAKSDYSISHVCPSVRPHGTTQLLLEGFSLYLIFQDFSKICRENSSFIKIGQE